MRIEDYMIFVLLLETNKKPSLMFKKLLGIKYL